jgi:hypothetical protein
MTKEETQRMIEVMQAWLKGKTIQAKIIRKGDDEWVDLTSRDQPEWRGNFVRWRIKPEPECFQYSYNDNLLGYTIMPLGKNEKHLIISQNEQGVLVTKGILITYYDLNKQYHILGKTN